MKTATTGAASWGRHAARGLAAALALLALASCGNRGALYLPAEEPENDKKKQSSELVSPGPGTGRG